MLKSFCAVLVFSIFFVSLPFHSAEADEFTQKDLKKWNDAFMQVMQEGEKLFHSPLGTNTVSCDMCHPNAANTHPET